MHPLNEYSQDPPSDPTEESRLVDLSLQSLFKATPNLPYFLHIPCLDLPFDQRRLRNEQEQWCQQYGFAPAEYHRQYTTFVYHDRSESCFQLRTDVDDARERKARERATSVVSDPPTPPVARKKISLAEYKSKLAGRLSSPSTKPPSSTPSPATKSVPVMNGNTKPNGSAKAPPRPEKRPEKRKSDSSSEEVSTPTKKVKAETDSDGEARPSRHGLPPMLSPIRSNPHGLPAMLSPTLPSDIEQALEEWEKRRPRAVSTSSSEKVSPVKSEANGVNGGSAGKRPPKEPPIHAVGPPTAEEHRNLSPTRRRLVCLQYGKHLQKAVERILSRPPRTLASPFLYTSSEGQPRGAAPAEGPGRAKEAARPSKDSRQEKSPKRRAAVLDDAKDDPRKRRRTLDASDSGTHSAPEQRGDARKTHTFATPKSHTTGMVRSLSNASAISTPRPTTPLAAPSAKSHRSTSASAPAPTGEKSDRARFLGELSRQWNDHGRKLKHAYEGIDLAPRRGHKPTPSSEHDPDDPDAAAPSPAARRKAVASLDCVIAYMVAFSFADARARAVGRPPQHAKTWATLTPLLHSVAHWTRAVPELEGLRSYLAYVVMRHMCDLMVAAATPGPAAATAAAATAAARPSPDSPEDAPNAAAPPPPPPAGSYLDPGFRALWQKAKSALWRATELLPAEDIQTRFPRTFAARARPATRSSSHSSSEHGYGGSGGGGDGGGSFATLDPRRRPREDGAPDAAAAREAIVRAPFALPVGECTTCPQAARFAHAALQEYLEENAGVGWTLRALQAPVLDSA